MAAIHAHVYSTSRDCDGQYDRSWVIGLGDGQDEYAFKAGVFGSELPSEYVFRQDDDDPYGVDEVTVVFTKDGFSFRHPTEEGFRAVEVQWCEDEDQDQDSTFRDHTAEAAGY